MFPSQGTFCFPDCFSAAHYVLTMYVPCFAFRCAFINFKDRTSAERAAEAWANGLDMDGERLAVRWGRSKNTAKPSPMAQTVVT